MELIDKVFFLEGADSDKIDLLDGRSIALFHVEVDADTIPFKRRDGRSDDHAIFSAREILALEFLFGPLQRCAVENATFGNAIVTKRFLQLVLVEFLEADKIDGVDRGSLFERDDQHITFNLEAHILEETGCKKRLDRLRRFLVRQGIADLHWKVAENSSRLGPLNPFNADILDDKRVECAGTRNKKCRHQTREQVFLHLQPEISRLMSL